MKKAYIYAKVPYCIIFFYQVYLQCPFTLMDYPLFEEHDTFTSFKLQNFSFTCKMYFSNKYILNTCISISNIISKFLQYLHRTVNCNHLILKLIPNMYIEFIRGKHYTLSWNSITSECSFKRAYTCQVTEELSSLSSIQEIVKECVWRHTP